MSAEGMPQAEPSLLARPLRWITRLVIRFPMPVLAMAVAAAIFSLFLTGTRLGFRTSRLDLMNPESGYNRLWIEYIKEFGDEDDAVVVVEGDCREQVVPVLEELSEKLAREEKFFHAILHEVDLSKIRAKGLYYLGPAELRATEAFLDKVEPITRGQWAPLNLGTMADGMCRRLEAEKLNSRGSDAWMGTEAELGRLAEGLSTALSDRGCYQSPWPEMPHSIATLSELDSEYLLTQEGRLGFVLLRLASDDKDSFAQGSAGIDALRRLIAQVERKNPEVKIGLTGLPVMENDEMRASQSAMLRASFLSLFGVACLFVAGFGGLRHPLMTVAALLLAMAWSFGYITLAVGHLNILSIAFGVVLIGLGIDFGVHYCARYLQIRSLKHTSDEALVRTASGVGPGIMTGTVTTAIAFFMAGFTEFTGIAELGLIAGGGILLCCLAALIVLPAMIHLSDANRTGQIMPAPLDIHCWVRPLLARPLLLLAITGAGTVAVSLGIGHLWYDHNLLNLQPEGLESVELERKLLAESEQSVWFALSIAESREELLERKQKFLDKTESVERVEEIASLFPSDHQRKRPIIERIQARLANLPEQSPAIPVDPPAQLALVLARVQNLLVDSPRGLRIRRQLEQIRDALRRMPPAQRYARLSDYQHCMAGDLLSRLHTLRRMANPEPPKLDDLPNGLVTRFVSQNNKFLLKIYSKCDIWDMDAMKHFVADVRDVDPRATGNPLQTYEASRQMKRSYELAGWYALAAIVFVLLVDFGSRTTSMLVTLVVGAVSLGLLYKFDQMAYLPAVVAPAVVIAFLMDSRSVGYALLAMVPLGLGMLQMFGLMGLLDIPLNPANMIVLPLILGIGIDDGVHIIHDFRRQRGPYRISASTASAVLITSLTTMVGFGSLMIASHQGLQSLGRVLTIGVSCCLFTSLIMLPALLSWIRQNSLDSTPAEEREAAKPPAPRTLYRRRDPADRHGPSVHAATPIAWPSEHGKHPGPTKPG